MGCSSAPPTGGWDDPSPPGGVAGRGGWEPGTANQVRVVATGGLVVVVAPLCTSVDVVDADLTLHGLKLAARHVGLNW